MGGVHAHRVFLRAQIPWEAGRIKHSVALSLGHCSLDLCYWVSTHMCLLVSLRRTAVEKKGYLCLIYSFPTYFISRLSTTNIPHLFHTEDHWPQTRFPSPLPLQGNQKCHPLRSLKIILLTLFWVCKPLRKDSCSVRPILFLHKHRTCHLSCFGCVLWYFVFTSSSMWVSVVIGREINEAGLFLTCIFHAT